MRSLAAILTGLLLSACASTMPTTAQQDAATQPMATQPMLTQPKAALPAPAQAGAQQYPAWLEMKPGYAETCINGGGCVPMTQAELQEMANDIVRRTMQMCRRSMNI